VNCPNTNLEFYHDFGSILGFIENNFGLGIGNINSVADGGSGYLFADNYAPEAVAGYPPLGDFFCLYQYSENYCGTGGDDPKAFEPIRTAGSYGYDYFLNYTGPLEAPDNDDRYSELSAAVPQYRRQEFSGKGGRLSPLTRPALRNNWVSRAVWS
jgi:hypothetical protein